MTYKVVLKETIDIDGKKIKISDIIDEDDILDKCTSIIITLSFARCNLLVLSQSENLFIEYLKRVSLSDLTRKFLKYKDPSGYVCRVEWLFSDRDFLLNYLAEKLDIEFIIELKKLGITRDKSYTIKREDHIVHTKVMIGMQEEKYSDVVRILEEWNIERILR